MQFFSTSKPDKTDEAEAVEKGGCDVLVVAGGDEEDIIDLTPTSSDKENAEVVIVEAKIDENKLSGKHKNKGSSCNGPLEHKDGVNADINVEAAKEKCKTEKKKSKKHKKHREKDNDKERIEECGSNVETKGGNKPSQNKNLKSCSMEEQIQTGSRPVITELETIGETAKLENENSQVSRKSNLRGKEMMDLLKEIKGSDTEVVKKKKHKKKHKKKDKEIHLTEKETHEISCSGSPDLFDDVHEEEIKGKVVKEQTVDETIERKEPVVELAEEAKKDTAKKLSVEQSNGMVRVIEDVHKTKLKKKKHKNSKSVDAISTICDNAKGKSVLGKTNLPESEAAEMSYTEYLEKVEMSMTKEKEETCVIDIEMICEDDIHVADQKIEKNSEINAIDIVEEPEFIDKPTILDKNIAKKFFPVLASTPDKTKKKADYAVVKDKKKKSKSDTKHAESISDCVPLSETKGITVINEKKPVTFVKKTQATLSFGKSGLTVSKPVLEEVKSEPDIKVDVETLDTVNEKKAKLPGKRGRPKKIIPAESGLNQDATDRCISKPDIKVDTETLETVKKTEKLSGKRGRPKKIKPVKNELTAEVNDKKSHQIETESDAFWTPIAKKRHKRKVSDTVEEDDDEETEGGKRRSHRKRYKVEAFQMDSDMKTPIKIKLKR